MDLSNWGNYISETTGPWIQQVSDFAASPYSKALALIVPIIGVGISYFYQRLKHSAENKKIVAEVMDELNLAKEYLDEPCREPAIRTDNYRKAKNRIDAALIRLPKHAPCHQALGSYYLRQGEPEKAKAAFCKSISLDKKYLPAHLGLAMLNFADNNFEESETVLNKAFKHGKSEASFLHLVGITKTVLNKFDEAEKYLRKSHSLKPNCKKITNSLALALINNGKHDDGLQLLRRNVLLNPDDSASFFNFSSQLYAKGKLKEAERCLLQFLEKHPNDSNIYLLLASVQFYSGQTQGAFESFKKSIDLDPRFPFSYKTYAIALEESGNLALSEDILDDATAIFSDNLDIHINAARICFLLEKFEKAKALLKRAAIIDPGNFSVNYYLGVVLDRLDERSEAEDFFRHALEIDSDSAVTHSCLAILLAKQRRDGESAYHFDQALNRNPNDCYTLYNFAILLDKIGDTKNAHRYFKLALENNQGDHLVHYNYGSFLLLHGFLNEAETQLRTAYSICPSHSNSFAQLSNTYLMLFDICYCNGDLYAAEDTLQNILSLDSENARAKACLDKLLIRKVRFG